MEDCEESIFKLRPGLSSTFKLKERAQSSLRTPTEGVLPTLESVLIRELPELLIGQFELPPISRVPELPARECMILVGPVSNEHPSSALFRD